MRETTASFRLIPFIFILYTFLDTMCDIYHKNMTFLFTSLLTEYGGILLKEY